MRQSVRLTERGKALLRWLTELRLTARKAALTGGVAGLVVGLIIVQGMRTGQTFTGQYQWLTAGAVLLAVWLTIGVLAGLTVLAPLTDEPPGDDPAT